MTEPQTVGAAVAEVAAAPEVWPKRFLVFTIDYRAEDVSASARIVTAHETEYDSAQDFAEKWFADHSVLRIYELRQMFGIGRFRG